MPSGAKAEQVRTIESERPRLPLSWRYRVGRLLQFVGLLILPFGIASELVGKVGTGTVAPRSPAGGALLFYVGYVDPACGGERRHVLTSSLARVAQSRALSVPVFRARTECVTRVRSVACRQVTSADLPTGSGGPDRLPPIAFSPMAVKWKGLSGESGSWGSRRPKEREVSIPVWYRICLAEREPYNVEWNGGLRRPDHESSSVKSLLVRRARPSRARRPVTGRWPALTPRTELDQIGTIARVHQAK